MLAPAAPPATERPNLTDFLAREIVALIRERDLAPGDRLPTAKELAEHFSVAMPTLREALRRLQATGVLDIRHGSGIYVRQGHERLMLANPAAGRLGTHLALQVLDSRLLIEPHLSELAARNAADDDLARIADCLAQCGAALGDDSEAYLAANNAFHLAIARASGNVVLAQVVESLIDLHVQELHAVDPVGLFEHRRANDHPDHLRVHDALRARDPILAGAAMRAHLAAARAGIVARLDPEPGP